MSVQHANYIYTMRKKQTVYECADWYWDRAYEINVWYFLVRVGMRGNLFAHLNRVVIEGSRGVGKRVKRQDKGSRTDLKIFVRSVLYVVYFPSK